MRHILLIEDDKDLNKGLTYALETNGYLVDSVFTLGEGMRILAKKGADMIILDGNLPDGDGFDFCRAVKKEQDIPVVFLTARDMEQDEITGFDCGAEDYIIKPFRMPVLLRRIEAAFRKGKGSEAERKDGGDSYSDGALYIDFARLTVKIGTEEAALTPTEVKILRLLISNKVVTKQLLLEKIWDASGNFVDEHAVAVNINRLRKKLEKTGHDYIKTMYGMGYQWKGAGGWN